MSNKPIVIVSPNEKRNRQRFVSEPLLSRGYEVLISRYAPLAGYLSTLKMVLTKKCRLIVFVGGAGIRDLILVFAASWANTPTIYRLGGNRFVDLNSRAQHFKEHRKLLSYAKNRFNLLMARLVLARINEFIVVNKSIKDGISERGNVGVSVISQYCYYEGCSSRKGIDAQNLHLLTVTNFNYLDKSLGVVWLVESLIQYARSKNTSVTFRVAGSGDLLEKTKQEVGQLSLPPNLAVVFLGYCNDVAELYTQADCLLYHSVHDATPNVILESKCFALPAIVNSFYAFEDLIAHEVNGFLFDTREQFIAYLERLSSESDLYSDMSAAARISHEQEFSLEAAARKIGGLVESVA